MPVRSLQHIVRRSSVSFLHEYHDEHFYWPLWSALLVLVLCVRRKFSEARDHF